MDMELTTGTYTHTKGEEGLEFWIKQGKSKLGNYFESYHLTNYALQ